MHQDYQKLKLSMRAWLQGKEYHTASEALEFASKFHTGTRKDGTTPEFLHQMSQAHFARTILQHLMHPEETLGTIFLHDVPEDYEPDAAELRARFGPGISEPTDRMNKVDGTREKSKEEYYGQIAKCPIASIAKGLDRMHNLGSMVGVFNEDKMRAYILETEKYVMPMLDAAAVSFPQQDEAYDRIRRVIKMQLALAHGIVDKCDQIDSAYLSSPFASCPPVIAAQLSALPPQQGILTRPAQCQMMARIDREVLPMLKSMRREQPAMAEECEYAKYVLHMQQHMIKGIHDAVPLQNGCCRDKTKPKCG